MVCAVSTSVLTATSCSDGETYAEKKEKEKKNIARFLEDNDFVGKINVIEEEQFYAQDSTTDVSKNQFVLFNDDGVYMQIVRKSNGPTIVELAKARTDSTVTRPLLCKFLEYDIQNGDTTYTNFYMPSIVDKMQCTYNHFGRSYSASFTSGLMLSKYNSIVPKGWLKPLDFIRLTKVAGEEAKVRLIVPHSSGTTNASGKVMPFYYEITYQLSPND
ncbi:MAG: DUF4827 domain-containing protein [Bacteroidaceae bacterium]|jgi:hypothetical protein|nr:DUF4827 domain-containing protein [Bacteroidaceae bacterium]